MSHSLLSAATLALCISYATSFGIIGYVNTSNVIEHLRLDLDQKAMVDALGIKPNPDLATAYKAYTAGETTHYIIKVVYRKPQINTYYKLIHTIYFT